MTADSLVKRGAAKLLECCFGDGYESLCHFVSGCAMASSLWDHVSQFVLVLQLERIVRIMLVSDSVQ